MCPMRYANSRVAPALLVSILAAALAGCNRPNAGPQDAPVAEVRKPAPTVAPGEPVPQTAAPVAQSPAPTPARRPAVESPASVTPQREITESPAPAAPQEPVADSPMAAKPQVSASTAQNAPPKPAPAPATSNFVAYYFHRTMRCRTCLKIEGNAKDAVERGFKADIDGGRLKWSAVDIELPGNEHFERDFALEASSLVLVEMNSDQVARWKNLEQVWDLVNDPAGFRNYVRGELRTFMEAKVAP